MSETSQKQPTMADLLLHVEKTFAVSVGDTIKGKVFLISKSQVLIDIENVGIGVVRGKEMYNEEYLSRLKLGEEIEAVVIDLDNEMGMLELSFRAIGHDKVWSEIKESYEGEKVMDAKIKDANRGGFLVKVNGVDGFLPASLLSPTHAVKQGSLEDKSALNQMKKYIGQIFKVKIISINPEADTFIVSEKSVSDEIAQAKLSKYKTGDMVEGTVVGSVDFGVFVRFDEDLEGLVHISEIAWKKVEDPKTEFKIGDKVKAKIVEIDKENRINLSIKQLLPNPWVDFVKNVKPGDSFIGTVSKIVTYGAIIVNEEDIQALCHISQLSKTPLESPAKIHELLRIGETKEFKVLSIDTDEKLYLTLLDLETAKKIQEDITAKQKEKQENSENFTEE
jgi:ribosomal protein S1